jgi:hypothetical protein
MSKMLCKSIINQKRLYSLPCAILSRRLNEQNSTVIQISAIPLFDEKHPQLSRMQGINFQIEYYDSCLNMKNIKYMQTSMPTIIMLPSSNQEYQDLDYFIGILEQKYRVLAFNFPGLSILSLGE